MSTTETEAPVAGPREVERLVQAFEAATDALNVFLADHPKPVRQDFRHPTEPGKIDVDAFTAAHDAHNVLAQPFESALQAANKALSACQNLHVGTVIRFWSSDGWNGSTSDFGVITKVTPTSYIVRKVDDSGRFSRGTARLDRANAHKYRSWQRNDGERSMHVVRTVAQDRAFRAAREAQEQVVRDQRNAERALRDAQEARKQALAAQQGILESARRSAVQALIAAHQAEFDLALRVALTLLAAEAPGRDETAPVEVPETA
jgi:hypothetical protein